MKSKLTFFFLMIAFYAMAQTPSDFENILMEQDTFLNGRDAAVYEDGDAAFPSFYNNDFGYWASGWAISSMRDTMTSGFTNLYSAKPGLGVEGSQNYAVGQQGAIIVLTGDAAAQPLKGVYLTNTTYAHNSMRDGDGFAKKFGGTSGDEPDFFKLTIQPYSQGQLFPDSVEFYLADYRFEDNELDYIVNEWTWVDLSSLNANVPLGAVDSLLFTLSSTDVGENGINTPLFYGIDNFNADELTSISSPVFDVEQLSIAPNPALTRINVELSESLSGQTNIFVYDAMGRLVIQQATYQERNTIDVAELLPGIYSVQQTNGNRMWVGKFVKL